MVLLTNWDSSDQSLRGRTIPKDKKYIAWIKTLPCILTLNPLSEPHHIPLKGHASLGMKTDDRRAIPLSHELHQEYHQHEIDYEKVIKTLNRIYAEKD
jgi:hypothetical protein